MSVESCAELVARGDPWRFRTAMLAQMPMRGDLMVLYAFNVEVSRAPWVASEPMIGEMRLQWWRDALSEIAEGRCRKHEVAKPLADVIGRRGLSVEMLDQLVAARRFDLYPEPHSDFQAFEDYVDRTAGVLMEAAARILGADDAAARVARDYGWGQGAAALLVATPELLARGRRPLPGMDADLSSYPSHLAIRAVGEAGRARINAARAQRSTVTRRLLPAFLPGCGAMRELRRIGFGPGRIAERARMPYARLYWSALSGRI